MKYEDIAGYAGINAVESKKVADLVESISKNGWQGAPILVCNMGLVTGSHRLAALAELSADLDYDGDALDQDVAEDVTDEINDYCEREGIGYDEIQFDRLRDLFAGTWVEEYEGQIAEW